MIQIIDYQKNMPKKNQIKFHFFISLPHNDNTN
jgi:hypothetical protein